MGTPDYTISNKPAHYKECVKKALKASEIDNNQNYQNEAITITYYYLTNCVILTLFSNVEVAHKTSGLIVMC